MFEAFVEAPELISITVKSEFEPDREMVNRIVAVLEKKGFKVERIPKVEFLYGNMWNLVFMKRS